MTCELANGNAMLSIRVASVVLQRRCTLNTPSLLWGVPGSCEIADHHLTITPHQTPIAMVKRPASTFFSRSREFLKSYETGLVSHVNHCLHLHFTHLQIRRMPCGRPTPLYQARAASAAERRDWCDAKI